MSAAVSTTTGTAHYGVTGWPLNQSLSPLLHHTDFAALGINALYMKWEVPPQKLPAFVESVRLLNIRGCSVTIPHKVELLPLLDEVSPLASRVGAANTMLLKVIQIGTISEAFDAVRLCYQHGWGVMPCDSRGEGASIADYCVGLSTGHLREGALGAVGYRFLQIEAELGNRAVFLGRKGFKP